MRSSIAHSSERLRLGRAELRDRLQIGERALLDRPRRVGVVGVLVGLELAVTVGVEQRDLVDVDVVVVVEHVELVVVPGDVVAVEEAAFAGVEVGELEVLTGRDVGADRLQVDAACRARDRSPCLAGIADLDELPRRRVRAVVAAHHLLGVAGELPVEAHDAAGAGRGRCRDRNRCWRRADDRRRTRSRCCRCNRCPASRCWQNDATPTSKFGPSWVSAASGAVFAGIPARTTGCVSTSSGGSRGADRQRSDADPSPVGPHRGTAMRSSS